MNVNEVGLGDGEGVAPVVCEGAAAGLPGVDEAVGGGCVAPAAALCVEVVDAGAGVAAVEQPVATAAERPASARSAIAAGRAGEAPPRESLDRWRSPLSASLDR